MGMKVIIVIIGTHLTIRPGIATTIRRKRRKLTLNRTEQNRTMSELVLLDSLTCEDPFDVSKQLVY